MTLHRACGLTRHRARELTLQRAGGRCAVQTNAARCSELTLHRARELTLHRAGGASRCWSDASTHDPCRASTIWNVAPSPVVSGFSRTCSRLCCRLACGYVSRFRSRLRLGCFTRLVEPSRISAATIAATQAMLNPIATDEGSDDARIEMNVVTIVRPPVDKYGILTAP